jgi:hypothetical protein
MAFHFLQLVSQRLAATRKFTFNWLRNLLVRTVVEREHPEILDESEAATARIRDENFGQCVAWALVDAVSDSQVREVLLRLQGLTIGELRNNVVHKDANRPYGRRSNDAATPRSNCCTTRNTFSMSAPSKRGKRSPPPSKPCRPHRCDSVAVLVGGVKLASKRQMRMPHGNAFPENNVH